MTAIPTVPTLVTDDLDYQLPALDAVPGALEEHKGKYLNGIIFDNVCLMRDFLKDNLDERTREMIVSRAVFKQSDRTERIQMYFVSIDSLLDNPYYGIYHNGIMMLSKQIMAYPTNKRGSK